MKLRDLNPEKLILKNKSMTNYNSKHTILFILFIFQVKSQSQFLPIAKFDPEPHNFCIMPFFTPMLKPLLPPSNFDGESESAFWNKIEEIKIEHEKIDNYNKLQFEKFKIDSINYSNCYNKFKTDLIEWRKRNPDWKISSKNKNDLVLSNEIKSENILQNKKFEIYIVSSNTLNIRKGAGTNHVILSVLSKGDQVTLLEKSNNDWWLIGFEGTVGYVFSKYITKDPYSDWEKKNYRSGVTPDCENIFPKYDFDLNNYLRIIVGSGTDVVVKLMKSSYSGDECIRVVYVRSGDTYEIKNIPEGRYYLKIAYGKDYRQKIIDNQCHVRFVQFAEYEKGTDILDYHKQRQPNQIIGNQVYENWSIPSYELYLDILQSNTRGSNFNSRNISEAEFNR